MIIPKILKDFFSYKNDGPQSETWEQKSKLVAHSEKDISEPVISFVKTFLQNTRRFKVKYDTRYWNPRSSAYSFIDKKLGYVYGVHRYIYSDILNGHCIDRVAWSFHNIPFELTKEETQYLVDNVVQYYIDREKRYKEIVEKIARKRLYEVYK